MVVLRDAKGSTLSYFYQLGAAFDQQYNRYRVSVSKTGEKIGSLFNGVGYILRHKIQFKMAVFCFLLLSDTKKTVFYVLDSKPKLDYTY
jgi:hypothetical protein